MCNYCDAYSAIVSGDDSQTNVLQSEAAQLLKPSLEAMLDTQSQSASTEPARAEQLDQSALASMLSEARSRLQDSLSTFAASDAQPLEQLRLAFGEDFSLEAALGLLDAWQTEDFGSLPTIAFLSSAEMGGAHGAYEAETATIYLSKDFFALYQNDQSRLVTLVAEEFGHHLDTVLNGAADSVGDEGAIFAAVLAGETLSADQLARLRQEDDKAAVEFSDEQSPRLAELEQNGSQISFENVTSEAGDFITARSYGGGAWGDLNGDGLPDLWVNNHFGGGETFNRTLFVNNGDGTFTDVVNNGSDVFIAKELQGDYHGSAWADVDNDGDQDLIQLAGGEGNTSTLGEENLPPDSNPNRLYINESGVLRDKAVEFGVAYDSAKAQAVVLFDYDNDGRLDFYHGSTQRADGLNPTTVFHQKQDGTFEDVGEAVLPESLQGKTSKLGGVGYFSDETFYNLVLPGFLADAIDLSTEPFEDITTDTVGNTRVLKGARDFAFADFNNDLQTDIYLARGGDDRLLLSDAEGNLVNVSNSAGIDAVDTSVGSGVVAADFDNDMDVDILVVRGNRGGTNLSNILFDNQGDGTFEAIANAGGVLPATKGVADNITTADYDVDGFVDLFVTNGTGSVGPEGGPQLLFRNQGNNNNWLEIDLEGIVTNRDGIGAKVFVTTADGVTQRRDQNGGIHSNSQNHQRLHFGLAQNAQIERIEIEWPSGIVQRIENVGINQVLKITEQSTDVVAPVAVADVVVTVEDTAVIFSNESLLSNDDLGDAPTTVIVVDTVTANDGNITINPDGTYTYTPAAGFVGIDSFEYTITDANGQSSSAAISVTVAAGEAPSSLPTDGLVLKLDADTGVATGSNSIVSSWADQSGLENDLLVSDGDPRLLTDALNGHNVIEFDGTGDKLSRTVDLNGLPAGNSERTVFLVARYDGTGYGGVAYGDNRKNQTFGAVVDTNGNLAVQGWGGANDFRSGERGTGSGWLLQEIVHDGATVSHYRDGSLIAARAHTYNTDVANGDGLVIGAEIDGSPNIDMDIATLLIYDRALSNSERQQVENYLQEKYFANLDDGQGGQGSEPGEESGDDLENSAAFLFSLRNGTTLDGVAVKSEDIVRYDGNSFSLFFDASDVGLSGAGMNVNAFTVISDNEILMSFDKALTIDGVGNVDDSDVVKFTATSLGEDTSGTFEMYIDGSDVGLTTGGEDIDGLTGLPDGSLLISTRRNVSVPGVSAENADLLLFNPMSLGENTSGSWSQYFDGSDVGLADDSTEYLDAAATDASGKLFFSVAGDFNAAGLSGADEDVFGFIASSTGSNTAGSFDTDLFFDGSRLNLASGNIDALSFDSIAL